MRTCWVIDHPAHFQLFRQWFRENDILVVTERQELDAMLADGFEQHILRVPRVQGSFLQKVGLGRRRQKAVRVFLRTHPVFRVISKGAPFELRAAKGLVAERWYLTDTEVNTAAHKLAKSTHVLLPESWEGSLKATNTYPGILPQAYVPLNSSAWDSAKGQVQKEIGLSDDDLVVFHRKLVGGGIHDSNEIVNYHQVIRKMEVHFVENKESAASTDGSAWELPVQATLFDGVLTGSTTLAAEAVVQGVPTLLISKAKRGFLTYLANQPHFFHWNEDELFDGRFTEMTNHWMTLMRETRTFGRTPVVDDTKAVLNELFGQPIV
jgi:predicted glycosyltransferase